MKKDPIFIVGLHRSGVNFLGSLLSQLDELQIIHDEELENLIYNTVLHITPLNDIAIQKSYDILYETNKKRIVHPYYPNLWRVSALQQQFPRAKFLCLIRDPYSGIQSMMKQEATQILAGSEWKSYYNEKKRHRFLGLLPSFIPQENVHGKLYEDFTLAERCALRWVVHAKMISLLVQAKPKAVMPVLFERLVFNNNADTRKRLCKKLAIFTGLHEVPIIDDAQIDKTVMESKYNFTEQEREDIKRVILTYFSMEGSINEKVFPVRHYFAPDDNILDLSGTITK